MPDPLPPDVRAAMAHGNKLEAIRLLRTKTGIGLAQAKEAVETGHMPAEAIQPREEDVDPLPAEVVAALQMGRKMDAIKLLREARRLGLKEAKDAVDAAERNIIGAGGNAGSSAPAQVSRFRDTLVRAAVIAVLLGAGWYLFGGN